jgi:hypothetical protein
MRSGFFAVLVAGLAVVGCKSGGGGGGGDAAGAGGAAGCPTVPDDLISDFLVDNSLHAADGRQGGWYAYGDDKGTFAFPNKFEIDPLVGNDSCSGPGSLHFKGMDFSVYGAAIGADFKPRPSDGDGGYGDKMTYDASAYRGIAFWAKSSQPLDGVQVSFPDLYTDGAAPAHDMPDPTSAGTNLCTASEPTCKCIYNPSSQYNCSPYLVKFGLKGDAAVDAFFSGYANYQLDTTWKRYQVLFVDTKQDPGNGGYHTPADRLDVAHLTAMAIQINADFSSGSAVARDFDVWIDDVSFIK